MEKHYHAYSRRRGDDDFASNSMKYARTSTSRNRHDDDIGGLQSNTMPTSYFYKKALSLQKEEEDFAFKPDLKLTQRFNEDNNINSAHDVMSQNTMGVRSSSTTRNLNQYTRNQKWNERK